MLPVGEFYLSEEYRYQFKGNLCGLFHLVFKTYAAEQTSLSGNCYRFKFLKMCTPNLNFMCHTLHNFIQVSIRVLCISHSKLNFLNPFIFLNYEFWYIELSFFKYSYTDSVLRTIFYIKLLKKKAFKRMNGWEYFSNGKLDYLSYFKNCRSNGMQSFDKKSHHHKRKG